MSEALHIEDLSDPTFNPFIPDELSWGDIADPYPTLARYRHEKSVHPLEYRTIFTDVLDPTLSHYPTFSVFSYDDVLEVLTRPEIFSNKIMEKNLGVAFGRSIVVMDPPEHTRYRKIFQKAFLPNIVRQWSDHIVQPVISDLFGAFEQTGKADLVQDLTIHFPFQIIYRQLGLRPEDAAIFHKLAATQIFWISDPEVTEEAGRKLRTFFDALLDDRRCEPRDDLVSLLANAEVDGEYLPRDSVVSFLRQLVNAGGDTTYRSSSTMLMCLLANPDQLEAVRNDRSLIPAAIEEAFRWDGPVITTWRGVEQDVTLGGVDIPAGSVVNPVLGSAHRDESKFADPDHYNIFRDRTHRHFGFSTGPHVCIGQHLARLEMERALTAILDRLPNLRLDPDYPPPESRGFHLRTPHHIHVRFDA
jgi:cytochrome P450